MIDRWADKRFLRLLASCWVFPWHPFSRWPQRLPISHWKKRRKKAVYYVPRSRYHCAKHCSVFISESRFPGHSLCQRSVWPLPCDGEQWGIKRAHLSCNWSLTYRSAASLFPPLYLALSLCGLDFVPFWLQIIQGWAGLYAFRVWWGQVRLSQHFADLALYKCTQVEENSRGGELQDRAYTIATKDHVPQGVKVELNLKVWRVACETREGI